MSLRHTFHQTSHKAIRLAGYGLHLHEFRGDAGRQGSFIKLVQPSRYGREPGSPYHYQFAAAPVVLLPVLKSRTQLPGLMESGHLSYFYMKYTLKLNYIIVLLFFIHLMKLSPSKDNYNTDCMLYIPMQKRTQNLLQKSMGN